MKSKRTKTHDELIMHIYDNSKIYHHSYESTDIALFHDHSAHHKERIFTIFIIGRDVWKKIKKIKVLLRHQLKPALCHFFTAAIYDIQKKLVDGSL